MWTISPFLPRFMKILFKFLFPSSLQSELLQIFLFTLKCIQKNWFLQFAHFYCHFYSHKTETRWLRQCRVVSYNQSENHSDHSLQPFFFSFLFRTILFQTYLFHIAFWNCSLIPCSKERSSIRVVRFLINCHRSDWIKKWQLLSRAYTCAY